MRYLVLVVCGVVLCACNHKKHGRLVGPAPPVSAKAGDTESGLASWYGHPYHGRQAANGEIYDMEKLTAAHRTLPFETWVHVTNLSNAKSVDVRITDRGPFVDGRITALPPAAAREIELIGRGVAGVRIEVVQPPPAATGLFAVQVGVFRDRNNAEKLRAAMAA